MNKINVMRDIKIEKVTLNIGAGKDQNRLEKGMLLLKNVTGIDPVKTFTNKRIPTWGLRPGLPIGCKITLRKEQAKETLKRLLTAKDNILSKSQIDACGNVAFGIPECIDIPDVKYDPEIGIMGLEACVTLKRPGYRIKKRKLRRATVGHRQKITKDEAAEYLNKEFNVKYGEE